MDLPAVALPEWSWLAVAVVVVVEEKVELGTLSG
jgi:hypothetical protein